MACMAKCHDITELPILDVALCFDEWLDVIDVPLTVLHRRRSRLAYDADAAISLPHRFTSLLRPVNDFVGGKTVGVPIGTDLQLAVRGNDEVAAIPALSGRGVVIVDRFWRDAVFLHPIFRLV